MTALDLMMTVTASTERAPVSSGGQVGEAVPELSSFQCLPLDPISPDSMRETITEVPYRALFTIVKDIAEGAIREGDILVVSSIRYPIHQVQYLIWMQTGYVILMVEDLRRHG